MRTENEIVRSSSFWTNLFKTPTEKDDLEQVLLSMPPFKQLGSKHLKALLKIIHNRFYSANEIIFYKGDPGIGLYIVREGEILIKQEVPEERDIELAILRRGDFFGEVAMLDEQPRSATATAVKDSSLAVIFKPDLDDFMELYPKTGINIIRGISQIVATRLRKLNDDFNSLLSSSSKK